MQHISKILKGMGFEKTKKGVILRDALSPEEKQSEHKRRVTWLEMMAQAPACCCAAQSMSIHNGLHRCNVCGKVYERTADQMVCIS